jgi:hypothetical protein
MNDDDRISYLAGDDAARDHTAGLSRTERDELDGLRGALRDPSAWIEPPADLQDRVVAAVAESVTPRRSRVLRYAVVGTAAATVLTVGLAVGLHATNQNRPVEYTAALTGTGLAPNASGSVTLTKTVSGWRIHLQATGLPRRDSSGYYEAWVKDGAGALVPVGTFNQPDDVTLWAGVPPTSHPTFTVTRQPANGNPASTGQVVLLGVAHLAR